MFTLTFSTFPILFVSNTDLKRDFVIFGYTATYTHTPMKCRSFVLTKNFVRYHTLMSIIYLK